MTRTEPTNHDSEPEERLAATAEALVQGLLACGFAERILLLAAGEAGSDLDRAVESLVASRKGSVRRLALPDDPTAAERALAAAVAQDLPDAIVNRGPREVAAWPCVRAALAGGSRLLELPGLDDAAASRCLAGIDLGSLRWLAEALVRRLAGASRLAATVEGQECTIDLAAGRRRGARPSDHLAAPLMRGSIASLPGALAVPRPHGTLLIGLHPTARADAGPLERTRSLGTVTLLDVDGRPVGSAIAATVRLDGTPIVRDGMPDEGPEVLSPPGPRGRRRGRLARTLDAAGRVLSTMPFRTFTAEGRRVAIAGPLTAQAAWLRGLTGRSAGRLERSDPFRAGGLRRRLRPDDVVIAALGGPRSRLERIGGREAGWLEVPTYARMVVPLGPLREKGLEAFAAVSHSTKDTLRYIRTKRLGWRTRPADPESIRLFEERYHVPTMVDRHGPEAAIRPPGSLLDECGRAELLEIIHEGTVAGMALFRPTAPRAELLQIGVLDGDEAWLRMRILALCYALPALECSRRDLAEYDFGRTPPFPWHPLLGFKSKWGAAVDPGPATDRLLVRLPAGSPATWHLLSLSGLVALRREGRPVAIVAIDAASDLGRLREVSVPGLAEILAITDGVAGDAIAAALEGVRNPLPVRCIPRTDLDRLAAIVG